DDDPPPPAVVALEGVPAGEGSLQTGEQIGQAGARERGTAPSYEPGQGAARGPSVSAAFPPAPGDAQTIGHPLDNANRLHLVRLEGALPECLPQDVACASSDRALAG